MVIKNIDGVFRQGESAGRHVFLAQVRQGIHGIRRSGLRQYLLRSDRWRAQVLPQARRPPAAEYNGTPRDAVERPRAAVPVYEALRHKNRISLISAEEIGGAFAAVFEWTDAVCMGRQPPDSHRRFMSMPVEKRRRVFADVLGFHLHVAAAGWVAIDFNDGSIMCDFDRGQTVICDIDFYRKQPVVNEMGRMWGSSHFMSPEEFAAGASIDETTNVFPMGATAFMLLGGGLDRSTAKWSADSRLHAIALTAVSENRGDRFRTLAEFEAAWKRAAAA